MKSINLILIFLLLPFLSNAQTSVPPLVDGKCQEYEGLAATVLDLDHGVKLHIYQNEHYVWLCYCYQPGSYGTLDLVLAAPELDRPLNLHVSAQLGEWPANPLEAAPKNPESDKWWNHEGWTANEIWPNGTDRSGEAPRPKFKNADARELQISKARFGKGDWKMKFNIRALRTTSGMANLTFPAGDESYILKVN